MTNEEMVVKIQNGNREYLEDLWQAVKKFIHMQAKNFYSRYAFRCQQMGVEIEDLNQAGYFAVVNAVKDYKGDYKFTTYLSYHLKTQFRVLTKMRNSGWENNTVYQARSLDEVIYSNSDTLLIDRLSDISSEASIDTVIENEYTKQLNSAISSAMRSLTPAQYEAISRVYFDGLTYAEYARERGVSNVGSSLIYRAFKKLRRDENLAAFAKTLS